MKRPGSAAAIILMLVLLTPLAAAAGVFKVSLRQAARLPGRVSGLEVYVENGRLFRVNDLPPGWTFAIDNGPDWNSKLRATATVTDAALPGVVDLDGRIMVEKGPIDEVPFKVKVVYWITGRLSESARFETSPADVVLTPVK